MTQQFNGKIAVDVRDSEQDWDAYNQVTPPEGSPNIVYLLWDDTGIATWEMFGGIVEVPNMQRIADRGLKYTNFHTCALCSPTRASLMTGRDPSAIGMNTISEAAMGFPGLNTHIPPNAAMVSGVLQEQGWSTYQVGKWHLTPSNEMNMAATKDHWPSGQGFDRNYSFLGGETSQWYPDLVEGNKMIDQPYPPEDGYHLSKDLVDHAITMIADGKQVAPDKPFYMYLTPGAGHAPHHIWAEWADKYKGKFDMGYEQYAYDALARMKKMGIVPDDTDLAPMNSMADATSKDGTAWPEADHVLPWDSLDDDHKKVFTRMAEVFAGFVSYTDQELGRLLDFLEDMGQLDNTIFIVTSDNGASGEGTPVGSFNENLFFNGIPDTIEKNLEMIDKLGGIETYNHYPTGWAQAFCSPYKMYKRYVHNGGIADPMIVSWPAKLDASGELRDQYCHVSDITPTVYDMLGIEFPEKVKGHEQMPLHGVSFAHTLTDAKAKTNKETQFYGLLGTRSIWSDGWKATTVHPAVGGWGDFGSDEWELYHTDADRSEMRELSSQHPEKLQDLKDLWFYQAGLYEGLPLDDREPVELVGGTPRPSIVDKSGTQFTYYPNTSMVPEGDMPSIRGRDYKFGAFVDLEDKPDGVLFANGSLFGGHSLYIKEGVLKYVNNFIGLEEQMLTSDTDLPKGKCIVGVEFKMKSVNKAKMETHGTATLFINDKQVAEQDIKTQLGSFSVCGEGFTVGRCAGGPATPDYTGVAPWAFKGGTIQKVVVDVSGDHYVDLELEAMKAFKND
jgi:arylsulfatase A-like enzyme